MKEKGYNFLLLIILHLPILSYCQIEESNIFDNTIIHEIHLSFLQESYWDSLTANYESNFGEDVPYLMANVIIDGEQIDSVGIRFKGFTSYIPEIDKRPMKIDFNEFVSGQKYGKLRKLNLNVGFADPSMIRDFIAYSTFRQFGLPAPRASYSKVYINDQYWGLYQNIEQIDKSFLNRHFDDNDGNLFKNQAWSFLEWEGNDPLSYQPPFELKTNEEENDWAGFISLLDVINNSPDESFMADINSVFNLHDYLRILATDVVLNNWDSHAFFGRNFYLYEDPTSNLIQWLPWDYNLSLGAGGYGVRGGLCDLKSDFVAMPNGTNEVDYINFSDFNTDVDFLWNFGDGNTSSEINTSHIYTDGGIYEVCLTVTVSESCVDTSCKEIDTNFNPENCPSISNGSSPHDPDYIFKKVIDSRPSCCDFWGGLCEVKYEEILDFLDGLTKIDLSIDQTNNSNILIRRLLNIDTIRNIYYGNICELLNFHFNENILFSYLDQNKIFIEEIVKNDSNYLYTLNQFENDYGDITNDLSLKKFISNRIDSLKVELANYYQCEELIDTTQYNDLVINEFMASNSEESGISDTAGDFDDWIEFYNNTDRTIDLSKFYLSDNYAVPYKWKFPSGSEINANDFMIVWCDNELNESAGELHTNFKLNIEGEEIILTSPSGNFIDSTQYPQQETNISYARIPNGIGSFQSSTPSFGQNNESTSTQEHELNPSKIKIIPNPSAGYIRIQANHFQLDQMNVQFYNSQGQIVKSVNKIQSNQRININDLSKGIYFVVIESKSLKTHQKLVVLD